MLQRLQNEQEQADQWAPFRKSPIYRGVIKTLRDKKEALLNISRVQRRLSLQQSKRLRLYPQRLGILIYREKNGIWSPYLLEHEIEDTLRAFYDHYRHYVVSLTTDRMVRLAYQPKRASDVVNQIRICDIYQFFSKKPPSGPSRRIQELEPLNIIRMDFLGPIKPQCTTGAKYILIVIDYFSRFIQAQPTEGVGGKDIEFFFEHVFTLIFGQPANVYSDNSPHFIADNVIEIQARNRVYYYIAPVYYPKSIGIVERLVQLVVSVLRKGCYGDPNRLAKQSDILREIMPTINTRLVRVYSFTPAKLFLGFNPSSKQYNLGIVCLATKEDWISADLVPRYLL